MVTIAVVKHEREGKLNAKSSTCSLVSVLSMVLTLSGIAAVVSVLGVSVAYADTLHGYCVPPAPACIDNGTITPTGANPPYFAFSYAGNINRGNGDFFLIGLVPDNKNGGFSLTLDGTNTTVSSVAGSLFSPTEWNSGKLENYLTFFTSWSGPSHPLSGYLPSTQGVDPGANGYFVYLFNFGAFDYKTAPGDPTFNVGSGAVPGGMVFLAVMTDANNNVTVNTPNSASILETGFTSVPEPSSLMLLGSGALGLAGVIRRRLML